MRAVFPFLVFLILNFGALAIGGLFTPAGVNSEWYYELNKAPWTPPGWVFGFAWTTIMIAFSFYMTLLVKRTHRSDRRTVLILYTFQLALNIGWNPLFFYLQEVLTALIVIIVLTILVFYFLFRYKSILSLYSLLILPYCIWLVIATSLNAYIILNN